MIIKATFRPPPQLPLLLFCSLITICRRCRHLSAKIELLPKKISQFDYYGTSVSNRIVSPLLTHLFSKCEKLDPK